jgi:hypothetical protein
MNGRNPEHRLLVLLCLSRVFSKALIDSYVPAWKCDQVAMAFRERK